MSKVKVQHQCNYCLCKVCNKIRCPRGKYHCLPCYHGTILECRFFQHKKVTRVYHINRRYRNLNLQEVKILHDALELILGIGSAEPVQSHKPLHQLLEEEKLRHKMRMNEILRSFHQK